MSKACPKCQESIPDEAIHCPLCGASLKDSIYPDLDPSPEDPEPDNPYVPMDAAIMGAAAEPMAPPPVDKGEKYGVPVEASAFISWGFLFWSQALGRLVLVSLIPLVPMVVLGVLAAVAVPFMLAGRAASGLPSLEGVSAGLIVVGVVFVAALFVLSAAAQAAMVLLLHDQARYGAANRGAWQAFMEGLRYAPRIIGMMLLVGLIAGAVVGLLALVGQGSVAGAVILGLGAVVGYFFLIVRWVCVLPAMVIDDCSVFDAFKYSTDLSRGYGWTVLGGIVLFILIAMGIGLASAVVGMIPLLGQLVNLGVNLLFAPLSASIFFAIYAGLKDAAAYNTAGSGATRPLRMG